MTSLAALSTFAEASRRQSAHVLVIDRMSQTPISELSHHFDGGVHQVTCHSQLADLLVGLASGLRRPKLGSVTLAGKQPWRSPEHRTRIAALFSRECLPPGQVTVADWLQRLESARGLTPHTLIKAHAAWGYADWASRPLASLGRAEWRSSLLLSALALPSPLLLALADPFSTLLDRRQLISTLEGRASAGAVVLLLIPDGSFSPPLTGNHYAITLSPKAVLLPVAPNTPQRWLVELHCLRVHQLAAALALHPSVQDLNVRQPQTLTLTSTDLEGVSQAIGAIALRERLALLSWDYRPLTAPAAGLSANGNSA